jgi:hypothetical protein
MGASDLLGLVLFASFGVWWIAAPRSVQRFYARFHRRPDLQDAGTQLGIRLAGLLWVAVVVSVVILGSKR